ncbi:MULTISPECIES: hypothetical protein [Gammaproteobacteria]|jgi:hypothetical protein|uniref:Uncharacterized protein n=1 Tax=Xanthomonas boreopolis TaxID=86183 RepID=A0A919KJ14_9XANT|nr:hypothetical protein [Pseudomonas sp. Hp2]GHH55942.1 hypothetical protein GCM10009090_24970 [[Pseudomonas] boreopolis]
MGIFSGLLFMHGHIASAELARQLAEPSGLAGERERGRARRRRERAQRRRAALLVRAMTALSPFR